MQYHFYLLSLINSCLSLRAFRPLLIWSDQSLHLDCLSLQRHLQCCDITIVIPNTNLSTITPTRLVLVPLTQHGVRGEYWAEYSWISSTSSSPLQKKYSILFVGVLSFFLSCPFLEIGLEVVSKWDDNCILSVILVLFVCSGFQKLVTTVPTHPSYWLELS